MKIQTTGPLVQDIINLITFNIKSYTYIQTSTTTIDLVWSFYDMLTLVSYLLPDPGSKYTGWNDKIVALEKMT